MNLLACDTSGPSVSVALWTDGQVRAERFLNVGLIHSKTFMPLVDALLEDSGCPIQDIDVFAVTTGPGSFTGIRIGVSAVKAMAYALDKPVVGLTTLDVLAAPYASLANHWVCPMLDARNQRVYAGIWQAEDQIQAVENQPLAHFGARLQEAAHKDPALAGIVLVSALAPDNWPQTLAFPVPLTWAPPALQLPRAGVLADRAARAWAAGAAVQPAALQATYFVRSAAERLAETNHGPDDPL